VVYVAYAARPVQAAELEPWTMARNREGPVR
jgi:hypothetical protein